MADIVKRVSLTTDTHVPQSILTSGAPDPTVIIENINGGNRVTVTFFIEAGDVNDDLTMTAEEIATAETKFIDLKLDENNNVFGGSISANVSKTVNGNIALNVASLLDSKPPHGPLD